MRKISIILCIWAIASVGVAQETSTTSLTGGFGASTDYLWRGITFSEHKPVIRGGMDYKNGGMNLGAWVSTSQGQGASETNAENGIETIFSVKYTFYSGDNTSTYIGSNYFYYPLNEEARYGRNYLGTTWYTNRMDPDAMKISFEVGAWDHNGINGYWPTATDGLEFRLTTSIMGVDMMALWEDKAPNKSDYQYYEASTKVGAPMSWGIPEDFSLGLLVGYSAFSNEKEAGTTSYSHYMVSANRNINEYEASIFFSDTNS